MAERNAYPRPAIKRGKNLLTDFSEPGDESEMARLRKFVDKQKPDNLTKYKYASLRENDCLNSSKENIIFNNSNSMVLNENTLNSFFEKLSEYQQGNVITEQSSQTSIKNTNMSKSEDKSSNAYGRQNSYRGQKMAVKNTNFRTPVGYNRSSQNNIPDGRPS